MNNTFLNTEILPFCNGCGHHLITKNTVKALTELNFNPLDVIIVTDIGCHGIIDKALNTHTVHGLHGRSTALAAGISLGIENENKKIIVFIGDGGATIGLQHILEAARMNVNLTVIVHNNFLYGMTGGQLSGLTPKGYKTTVSPDGSIFYPHDICKLAHTAGANYVSRVLGIGDFSGTLKKAFSTKGFSLVEVMEICPSYGVRLNPKKKLQDIVSEAGFQLIEYQNDREVLPFTNTQKIENLFELEKDINIYQEYEKKLNKQIQIVLSGSAGEGVQNAATFLSKLAIMHNYHVTQKGNYPVTVGVGFSAAEINISPTEIYFHGLTNIDYAIVSSEDGFHYIKNELKKMQKNSIIFIDSSLPIPETNANLLRLDLRKFGGKNAMLIGLFYFIKKTNLFEINNFIDLIKSDKNLEKFPLENILDNLKFFEI